MRRAVRIALVGPLPPPSGGMANQTLQLASLLRGEGFDVELIQMNAPYRPAWAGRIKGVRALFRLLPYLLQLRRAARRVQLFHVMANSGWSWHLFAAPAIWIARLNGCPVVLNYRGGLAEQFLQRSLAWVRPSLLRADCVVVPSGFLYQVFDKYGIAATVVPNVVSLERFSPAFKAGWPSSGGPRVLVARNLEAIYDNATALRAFSIVVPIYPNARLVVAGSGPLRPALERLAGELGIGQCVTFTGQVDRAGMAQLYRDADLVLNPSTVDNTPNSVLEALASGVPVVSTNVGGVPFLVEDGKTALLVAPGAPRAMADAMLRLLGDPSLALRLREAGIAHVRQFDWTQVRPALLQAYRAVQPGLAQAPWTAPSPAE
jgi:L-malate glycosyltransferase